MNNKDLVGRISLKTGLSTIEVSELQSACVDSIIEAVNQGKTVMIQGFGGFEVKTRAARKMFNPRTGETQDIPERCALAFRQSNVLKEKLNQE